MRKMINERGGRRRGRRSTLPARKRDEGSAVLKRVAGARGLWRWRFVLTAALRRRLTVPDALRVVVRVAWLHADLVEHALPPHRIGHAARLVFGERVFGSLLAISKSSSSSFRGRAARAVTPARSPSRRGCGAEAPRRLNPVLDEGVAQSVLRFGNVKVRAFDDQTIFA